MFPDEKLLVGGAGIDSRLEDVIRPVSRLPMRSERCGRLAARTEFEYSAHNMKRKNMACDWEHIKVLWDPLQNKKSFQSEWQRPQVRRCAYEDQMFL